MCRKISRYDSIDDIPQDPFMKNVINSLYDTESHSSIKKTKDKLKALYRNMDIIKDENKKIKDYMEDRVKRCGQIMEYNEKTISLNQAYACLIERELNQK